MAESVSVPFIKIALIGPPGSGKTCLVNRIHKNQFDENLSATVGLSTVIIYRQIGTPASDVKVQLGDTPGQQTFLELTVQYIRDATSIFLVYDISNSESIDQLKDYIAKVRSVDPNKKIFIVGNKKDLDTPELQAQREGKLSQYENDCNIIPVLVSAKTGDNVETVLSNIIQQTLESKQTPEIKKLDLNSKQKKEGSKGCC